MLCSAYQERMLVICREVVFPPLKNKTDSNLQEKKYGFTNTLAMDYRLIICLFRVHYYIFS
jgi:hypothetical protein